MKKHSSLQVIRDEHASLAAMLQSMRMMVERGPSDDRRNFFDVVRAMLFYIDEFPERLHHPKESNLLFPKVVKAAPKVMGAVDKLERDHMYSEKAARDLQHLLLSWELLGSSRRQAFEDAFKNYVDFYLAHMHLEETVILPEAERCLSEADWVLLDQAFAENADPLTGHYPPTQAYEKLFSLIVTRAPSPIGLG
ncbi:hemerythrin [Limnohabitans sp. MMS-10A-160]|uniref:hemerythrin domain-containing protein n=1 Tax=unclassified Limnohabitans TaxID=2626134 RepID=UPI000D39D3A1|nr:MULTISPECIES: hemerythrin domain-containing protein [unclassified Limnohabitans]PUE20558.1 hemerythrin [Limnohabitans sp. MMS-10A-192]PUE25054.1 hemerythrin [Limnohabitans sp. MMS-10A-160]